jgi:hypothetical protein
VVYSNRDELGALLRAYRYRELPVETWDAPEREEWLNEIDAQTYRLLKLAPDLFDEGGRLRILTPDEWDGSYISSEIRTRETPPPAPSDDDIPF